jgi:3-methyladenine DNA glycosylase AlkD
VLGLRGLLRDGHEFDRFERYADTLLTEREFFIRKVLGWVARDTGRHHPATVSAWVRANLAQMSGVTIREAVKYLPDGEELLTRWKADQSAAMARRKRVG